MKQSATYKGVEEEDDDVELMTHPPLQLPLSPTSSAALHLTFTFLHSFGTSRVGRASFMKIDAAKDCNVITDERMPPEGEVVASSPPKVAKGGEGRKIAYSAFGLEEKSSEDTLITSNTLAREKKKNQSGDSRRRWCRPRANNETTTKESRGDDPQVVVEELDYLPLLLLGQHQGLEEEFMWTAVVEDMRVTDDSIEKEDGLTAGRRYARYRPCSKPRCPRYANQGSMQAAWRRNPMQG